MNAPTKLMMISAWEGHRDVRTSRPDAGAVEVRRFVHLLGSRALREVNDAARAHCRPDCREDHTDHGEGRARKGCRRPGRVFRKSTGLALKQVTATTCLPP